MGLGKHDSGNARLETTGHAAPTVRRLTGDSCPILYLSSLLPITSTELLSWSWPEVCFLGDSKADQIGMKINQHGCLHRLFLGLGGLIQSI